MAFRRRHFQQNRSKSAIDIATDFLVQTTLQDSPKTSSPNGARKTPSSSPSSTPSPNVQGRFRLSPFAFRSQSQASSLGGSSKGASDVGSKDSGLCGDSVQSDTGSLKSTGTPSASPHLPHHGASERAEGDGREGQKAEEKEGVQQEPKTMRKLMFDSVCTIVLPESTLLSAGNKGSSSKIKKKSAEVRARWKKATLETLLVLRLNKEESDKTGQDQREGGADQRIGYVEVTPCTQEVRDTWDTLLRSASSTGSPPTLDYTTLLDYVKKGVPRELRGMVWKFLALQQTCHSGAENCSSDMYEVPYTDLLEHFSSDQHAILIDLGRTFPGHPYFVKPLGPGQVSLFNLLKAYSLLDTDVGYCQGISFIAGLLLMHMDEEAAFEMIRHLMLGLGFRSLYCPNMVDLQMKLYQMVRLLFTHDAAVFFHLHKHEVAPALYATPWFLTLFASQYPLCFVARVFDLLFLQGPDVIFKVALTLMKCHRELILQVDCFEDLVDFLKTGLPEMARIQNERITAQAIELDIHQELHDYEIEFHVFRDELLCSSTSRNNNNKNIKRSNTTKQCQRLSLQQTVLRLQDEKKDLDDQLDRAHSEVCTLNMSLNRFRLNEDKFKARIRALELERSALLSAVSQLRTGPAEHSQSAGKGC
ncbi:hypothetical protein ACOMHN_041619 [Nucella lapillus]